MLQKEKNYKKQNKQHINKPMSKGRVNASLKVLRKCQKTE